MYAPRYWIGLLALVAVWGSSYALIELALPVLGPLEVTFLRVTFGLALLAVVCLLGRIPLPRARGTLLKLGAVALFGNVAPFLLISWGQTHVDSAVAGVLMSVMPLSVLVFTRLFLPDDPLTPWHWVGFLCGMLGVAVLMAPDLSWPLGGPLAGHLAVLAGALSYGLAAVVARSLPPGNVWANTTVLLAMGLVLLLPAIAIQTLDLSALGANVPTLAVAFLGIFSTSLAGVLFLYVVRGTSAAFISNINFLIPIWAVLLGSLALGEELTPSVYGALALVLVGIAVSQRGARRSPQGPAPSGPPIGIESPDADRR